MTRRTKALLALGLAALLVGGGVTAWRTVLSGGTEGGRLCWGALSPQDVRPLLPKGTAARATEDSLPEQGDSHDEESCRVSGRLTVQWRETQNYYENPSIWSKDFLSVRMTPLGGGLAGMASDNRAWLALPEGCAKPHSNDAPVLLQVTRKPDRTEGTRVDAAKRAAMARVAGLVADRLVAAEGCTGRVRLPVPGESGPRQVAADGDGSVCGVPAADWPGRRAMGNGTAGPARICEAAGSGGAAGLRLTTVTDPRVARVFTGEVFGDGKRIKDSRGHGQFNATRAAFGTTCVTGDVVFTADAGPLGRADFARVFRTYVAAEAVRLHCGPLHLKL